MAATGAEFLVPYQLGLLGDAQAALGQRAAALATVEAACDRAAYRGAVVGA
jgi:hypothetical protein